MIKNAKRFFWLLVLIVAAMFLFTSDNSAEENQATQNPLAACDKLLDEKNYDEALTCYEKRIEQDPSDGMAFRGVSMVFSARQAIPEGQAWFDKYLSAHPQSAPALYGRANLRRDENPKAAITDVDAALALDPKLALAWNLKGLLLRNSGELEGALAAIDRAIAIDPTKQMFFNNFAETLVVAGREDEIVERIQLQPNGPQRTGYVLSLMTVLKNTFIRSGSAKLEMDDEEAARILYLRAIALAEKAETLHAEILASSISFMAAQIWPLSITRKL